MPANDEAQIIRRAQSGQREAFGILHDRNRQAIFNYIYYRVGDQGTAEDLTAEVFLRMVEKLDRYRDRGKPFIAWLYTIARNLLTDHYRRNGNGGEILPLNDRFETGDASPLADAENQLAAECLQQALRSLTEEQRQVIVGKFIEDRSNAEMARILSKSEGAVKSLQHRALAALRRAIEKEGCYEP